jgi:DNA-binding NtrC family response regulator
MADETQQGSPHRGRILVVDDDMSLRLFTAELLRGEGHEVEEARSGVEALELLGGPGFDLVLADLMMPGLTGLDLLRAVQRDHPGSEVIIITGHGDVDTAVEAMREGAYDFVTKPYHPEKLLLDVQKALERKRMSENLSALRREVGGRASLGDLQGASSAMQQLYRRIEQVAPTGSTVLVLGESGTGKELTARELHRLSRRREGPFLAVNCGALPANLLESELFGHVKGAFTGATADKAGLFQAAEGGTLFLDEIGATTARTQIELLRVLDSRELRPVGATAPVRVDVRIVAATNLDLEQAIDSGEFRADLYYRLSPVILRVPPLRERLDDVPMLAEHFLAEACRSLGRPPRSFSPRSVELLRSHPWPGNVRELQHVVENAVIFASRPVIRPADLPEAVRGEAPAEARPATLDEVVERHVLEILEACGGNKARAAKLLGIPRASLYRRLERIEKGPTDAERHPGEPGKAAGAPGEPSS